MPAAWDRASDEKVALVTDMLGTYKPTVVSDEESAGGRGGKEHGVRRRILIKETDSTAAVTLTLTKETVAHLLVQVCSPRATDGGLGLLAGCRRW